MYLKRSWDERAFDAINVAQRRYLIVGKADLENYKGGL